MADQTTPVIKILRGNVGIGTNPSVKLDISSTDAIKIPVGTTAQRPTAADGMIRLNTTTQQFEGYHNSNWQGLGGVIDVDQDTYVSTEKTSDDDTLFFYTSGVERARITNAGNVGIGVTNPDFPLEVAGAIGIDDKIYHNGDHNTYIGFDADSIVLRTGGTDALSVNSSQNVGIGTTSPDFNLHIEAASDPTIRIQDTTNNSKLDLRAEDSTVLIRSTGNHSMRFDVNQTERMRLDTSGNLGIGTTSPNAKLEISGDTRSGGRILYGGTESNYLTGVSYASIYGTADTFESVSGLFGSLVLQSRSNTDRPIIFVTGATPSEKMRLTSDGNLGIGTTSPSRELEIQGSGNVFARITASTDSDSAALELNNNGNELWTLKADDTAADYFKITNNAGTALTIDTSRNVGIGTTSPTSLLHIDTGANSAANFRLGANRTVANAAVGQLIGDWNGTIVAKIALKTGDDTTNKDDGEIAFEVAAAGTTAEAMRIQNDGKVGIGTTSPSYPLTVAGADSIGIDDYILHNGDGNTKFGFSGADTFKIRTGGVDALFVNSSQNVGIGVNPGSILHVKGSDPVFTMEDTSAPGTARIQALNGSLILQSDVSAGVANSIISFKIDNTEYARFNSDGYFGIGTTSAIGKLHIYQSDGSLNYLEANPSTENAYIGNIYGRWNGTNTSLISFRTGSDTTNKDNGDIAFFTSTSGSLVRAMTIDENQRVGIGTTSPEKKLHVSGSDVLISNNQFYSVESTAGTNYKIAGITSGNVVEVGAIDYTSAATVFAGGGNIQIKTGGASGTERVRITSDGNVGIGTASPDYELEVSTSSNSRIAATSVTNSVVNHLQADSSGGYVGPLSNHSLFIKTNNTTRWTINTSGNLIGAGGQILYGDGDILFPGDAANFSWDKSESELLIQEGAKVGIGTTSPSTNLHVNAAISTVYANAAPSVANTIISISNIQTSETTNDQAQIQFNVTGGSYNRVGSIGLIAENAGNRKAALVFTTDDAGSRTEKMRITGDGELQVTGNGVIKNQESGGNYSYLQQTSSDARLYVQYSQPLLFGTAATERMRIAADGDVGIGVSPSTRLHVSNPAVGQSGSAVTSITTTQATDLGVKLSFTGGANSDGNIIGGIALGNGGEEYAGIYALDGGSSAATDLALFAGDTNGINEAIRIDSSGNVGVGVTSPTEKLHVAGNIYATGTVCADAFVSVSGNSTIDFNDSVDVAGCVVTSADAYINSVRVGRGAGSISSNTVVGCNALNSNTTGSNNIAVGNQSIYSNTSGTKNIAVGIDSLYTITAARDNVALGFSALKFNTVNANTAVGSEAFLANTTGTSNVGIGYKAGRFNTTGSNNTASGYYALKFNTTASENTATGSSALRDNTTGVRNTAHGRSALLSNTTGNDNVAFGRASLYSNTTGSSNTAVGKDAIYSNTSGARNTAVGLRSLYANTTGTNNTASGYYALRNNVTGADNTALGYRVLRFNTAGSNTAVGANAMFTNTTGTVNTAVGKNALYANTSGSCSTAIGHYSLSENTTGAENTALGYEALKLNTTGAANTAHGSMSLRMNTTGSYNTASGRYSLGDNTTGVYNTAVGSHALNKNTSGDSNVAVGFKTLCSNLTGVKNTASGMYALKDNTASNNTAHGYSSLLWNTTGSNNTASGYQALRSNTSGLDLTAFGSAALYNNTTGCYNAALGRKSLCSNTTACYNSAIGASSLQFNTTGGSNSALGHNALRSNTTGGCNAAFGQAALCSNTTGQQNTALGRNAMCSNSTGSYNAAVGQGSLASNTTGAENNAFGWGAMGVNTTGAANTASGHYALFTNSTGCRNTAHGWKSLYSNTTGSCNTAVGRDALGCNTVGTNNIGIGYQAAHLNTVASNNVAIGLTALYYNKTGTRNTAIGTYAAHKTCNINDTTAIGYSAAFCNTTGAGNTALGSNSLYANTTGASNSALGHNALRCNTTASNNVATGKAALQNNTTGANNTASGTYSLYKNTTAIDNASFGSAALQNNTTGSYNSAFGRKSLNSNTTSHYNSALGYEALYTNSTGSSNTGIGFRALRLNTTGSSNTAVGKDAMYSNTTGLRNSASGMFALGCNVTGSENTASGYKALWCNTANYNTAVGNQSLQVNSSGTENTALGAAAGTNNTTGSYNTALGAGSFAYNTTGSNNTTAGRNSLRCNTTGPDNAAFGYQAMQYNTTGGNNTAMGRLALQDNTTGYQNTALGNAAMANTTTGCCNSVVGSNALPLNTTGKENSTVGTYSLYNNTTGSCNVAMGFKSLCTNTTGNHNVAVGSCSLCGNTTGYCNTALGVNAGCGITTESNAITIGINAVSCGSNTTVIGNSSTTNTYLCGTVHATCFTESSSVRYKRDVKTHSFNLDCLDKVRPVSYITCSNSMSAVGYIAEELNEIYPEVVSKDRENRPDSINYARMVVILTEKVKDLQSQINKLKESRA